MKRAPLSLLLSMFTLTSSAAFAAQADGCLDASAVKRVNDRFEIRVDGTKGVAACDPSKPSYQLAKYLIQMESLQLTGAAPAAPWNQSILPANWLGYLQKLSPKIWDSSLNKTDPQYCQKNPDVSAYVTTAYDDTMFICPGPLIGAGNSSKSLIETAEVLMHESRHHEGNHYFHANCNKGQFIGRAACDADIEDRGSYAVTVEAYSKFAMSAPALNPVSRELARHLAVAYGLDRFNKTFFTNKEAVLLREESGGLIGFDGVDIFPVVDDLPHGIIAPRRDAEFTLYPEDGSLKSRPLVSYDWRRHEDQQVADGFGSAYDGVTPEQRAQLIDVFYMNGRGARYGGIIFDSWVNVNYRPDDKVLLYSFAFEKEPIRRMFTAEDFNAAEPNRVYLLGRSDQMYRVELLDSGKTNVVPIDNPIKGFRSLSRIGETTYLLRADGRLFERHGDAEPKPVADLEAARFESMTRPFQLFSSTPFQ